MSELAKEKLYRKELIKAGAKGNNNVSRIRSLAGGGSDNTFIVTLTVDTSGEDIEFSQDKTNAEIYQALVDGKLVFINCDYHTWNGRVCLLSQQVTYGKVEEVAVIGDSTIEYTFYSPYDSNQTERIVFDTTQQKFVVLN